MSTPIHTYRQRGNHGHFHLRIHIHTNRRTNANPHRPNNLPTWLQTHVCLQTRIHGYSFVDWLHVHAWLVNILSHYMACRYVCFTGVCILDIHQIHRIFMIIYAPPSWNAGIECIFPHASSPFSIPATLPFYVQWKLLFQVLCGSPAGFNCKQFGHRSRDCPEPPDEAWAYRLPV